MRNLRQRIRSAAPGARRRPEVSIDAANPRLQRIHAQFGSPPHTEGPHPGVSALLPHHMPHKTDIPQKTTEGPGRRRSTQDHQQPGPQQPQDKCRRRPTLPHPPRCSTIGAGRLSFRVRKGTGRDPAAKTTDKLKQNKPHTPNQPHRGHWCAVSFQTLHNEREYLTTRHTHHQNKQTLV